MMKLRTLCYQKKPQIAGFLNFYFIRKRQRTEKKLEKLLFTQAATIEFIRLSGDKKLGMDGRMMEKLLTDSPG